MSITENTNAARLRNGFETCRHVDTAAKYVSIMFDDIADVDSYPELDSIVWRNVSIAFDHTALNIDSATHRVQSADEFDHEPIESPSPVLLTTRPRRATIVNSIQTCRCSFSRRCVPRSSIDVPRDIGRENGRQPSL